MKSYSRFTPVPLKIYCYYTESQLLFDLFDVISLLQSFQIDLAEGRLQSNFPRRKGKNLRSRRSKQISEYSKSPRIFNTILFSRFDWFEMNEINSYLIKFAMERHGERVTAHEVHDHFELFINGLFEGDKLNGFAFFPTKFFLCHKDSNSVYSNLSETCTPMKRFRLQIKMHTNINSIIEFFSMNTKSLINLKNFAAVVQNSSVVD